MDIWDNLMFIIIIFYIKIIEILCNGQQSINQFYFPHPTKSTKSNYPLSNNPLWRQPLFSIILHLWRKVKKKRKYKEHLQTLLYPLLFYFPPS